MSVTRISEFRARAGTIEDLRAFLVALIPGITSTQGCQSCQLLQSHDEPARFLMVEVWDSIEVHEASVRQIPPESLARAMALLDGPPQGHYFSPVTA